MTILNLKVKYFYRFIEFKQTDTIDSCSIPILGIDNITGYKVTSVYPSLTLDLERMCFGAPNDFAVNLKFNQTVDFVDGC